jgi:hypothetical protein
VAVSLAHYNAETMLTYAQLETGPPHAKIDEGCDPWNSMGRAPLTACPESNFPPELFDEGVPYDYSLEQYFPPGLPPSPNVNDPTFAKMDDYHGITGPECGKSPTPTPSALTTFAKGSIMSESDNGWDNHYSIPVDMFICSNGINGANVGGLWFAAEQAIGSGLVTHCYGDGSGQEPPGALDAYCFSEKVATDPQALEDMQEGMLNNCATPPPAR